VVAGRLEVPVVGVALLLIMNRALAGVHLEHDAVGAVETVGLPSVSQFNAISPIRSYCTTVRKTIMRQAI
jgi:hypothetical protein